MRKNPTKNIARDTVPLHPTVYSIQNIPPDSWSPYNEVVALYNLH